MVVGVGLDLVDLERFRTVLDRTPGVARRAFTAAERADAAHGDPVASLAARFAAKEAVLKTLGVGIDAAGLREIEVRRRPGGQPALTLTGRAARLAAARGIDRWHVSLTHTAATAGAVVVGEDGPGGRP